MPAFARPPARRKAQPRTETHAAIEREFAEKHVRIENLAEETSLAAGQAQRHGQIESGAFLADVGRCEIDGEPRCPEGKIETAIAQGLARMRSRAFFHGNVRQADDREMPSKAGTTSTSVFDEISRQCRTRLALNVLKSIPRCP